MQTPSGSATSSSASSKSRREVFEETAAPPRSRWSVQQCSLRGNDELPVASTSKSAGLRLKDGCYATLSQFRANDKGRQNRLRKLYDTLNKEWAVPHTHDDVQKPTGTTSKTLPSAYPAPHNAEERRVADVRKEYLRELYHSLCPGDSGKESGPTLAVFTDFVEQKEEALWRLFCEIDKDNDMQLHPDELHAALKRSDINISLDNLRDMIKEMDKDGTGKVTFEEWRDFLLLLPRPTSLTNIWTYWKSHSKQPRLASSIATQDLDVILAEKPAPQASASSFSAGVTSSASSVGSAASQAKGKGRELPTADEESDPSAQAADDSESEGDKPIFEGSAAYLLAGGLAGAVSRTATAPFDRLKVYLINHVDPSGAKLPSVTKTATHPIKAAQDIAKTGNKGLGLFANSVKDLYNQGGLKAFFVGNGLNIIKIFPESAVKFWSYEYSKRWFARNVDHCNVADISGSSRFIAGGLGGVTSQLLIYPLETWKTRVMSSTSQSGLKGNALYLATAKDMAKTGGVRAYYSGLSMGLIGVFPYSAIDMSLFAAFKKAYMKYTGDEEPGPMGSLTFGALSGGLGATSVYPLNLLRTRMQTQGTPAHPQKYTGWRDVAMKCYRNEGFKGFYKGLSPTLLKVSPSMGISWLVYEYSTSLFFPQADNGHNDSSDDTNEG